MFTGIIETMGTLKKISVSASNKSFWIESPIGEQLKIDQSLSHDGVCLTVEALEGHTHKVTAIQETLGKTNINTWKVGNRINLERCLLLSARLDGHFVQGHVDTRGIIKEKKDLKGSWKFTIEYPPEFAPLLIEKGSVALNGISLTSFGVSSNSFSVAIIPYTLENTNLRLAKEGDAVNLEFDMVGKYLQRWVQTRNQGNVLP